ncbi:MAG TPA: hypothetical protein VIK28_05025, partial [Sedimentisphaerales bacterium]
GFVNSYQNGVTQLPAPPVPVGVVPFQPQVGTGNSILADAGLTYALLKTTNVSVTAAQAIVPTITGQLQKSETIGLSVNHAINYFSNLSFATSFSFMNSSQGAGPFTSGQSSASEFFSANVNYGYMLSRDWRTNISYTYRQRDDNTGLARSSTILFSLARDFTLLGDPTGINQAEAERARQRERNSVGYVFPN